MNIITEESLPSYFWNDLKRVGTASLMVPIPDSISNDPKCWVTSQIEPDFPRPGYSKKSLSEHGRLNVLEYYNNIYVPGYWTILHLNGKIICFKSLKDLEQWLNNNYYNGSGIVNPNGQKCKITAVPYE